MPDPECQRMHDLNPYLNATVLDTKLDEELREACNAVWWRLPRRPVIEGYR